MVATVSPPTDPQDVASPPAQQSRQVAASDQDRRIRQLEDRAERQAVRRDGATLVVFTLAATALLASVLAVGLGMRAITESKRNIASGAAAAVPTAVAPHAALSEFKVDLSATTLPAGQLSITIDNAGTVPHELLVFRSELSPAAYPLTAAGNIDEEAPSITKMSDGDNLDPGASQTRTIDLTQPGKYLFVCNLPGHFASGMYTEVTVG
jgi:uncharacterized cupredoxin-like copper-binding protein